MKKKRNKAISLLVVLGVGALTVALYFIINLTSVSKDTTLKEVTINKGGIRTTAETLKENKLIKNVSVFIIYTKLTGNSNLKAGVYKLSESMGAIKIIKELSNGSNTNPDEVTITFREGINIRKIASLIEEKTNNSYDDVISLTNDNDYLDELISKYWFLTDDIKNKDIYYSLEGYLYPNTYRFTNKDVSIKDIFTKMLDETDEELSPYKEEIENSNRSIHEIITLASVVELEVANDKDRKDVAGVIFNRLNSSSYNLGCDSTTYYALKIDDWSTPLSTNQLNSCNNKYNTRCGNVIIPVGPICNSSVESIKAILNPSKHNYYYFVTDCNGKSYFTTNQTEHNNTISKLRREGNWCA